MIEMKTVSSLEEFKNTLQMRWMKRFLVEAIAFFFFFQEVLKRVKYSL